MIKANLKNYNEPTIKIGNTNFKQQIKDIHMS